MKKLLLATTALAGVAAAAGGASAQTTSASEPIKLTVGGYFQFYGAALLPNQASGASPYAHRHNVDIFREAEIHFKGETRLDNGLIIGVQVELEAESCIDQIDESYIWFQGGWGRLLLGSTNSAAYKLAVGAPTVDNNYDGQDPNYRLFSGGPVGTGSAAVAGTAGAPPNTAGAVGDPRVLANSGGQSAIDAWVPLISGDSEKITYLSPRFAGFRFGASYTPDDSEDGNTLTSGQVSTKGGSFAGFAANNNATQWSNDIAAGINYESKLGPVDLQAAIGAEYGHLEGPRTQTVGGFTSVYTDRVAWQAGVDAGFAGFHLGGGYYEDDNGIDCTIVAGVCSGGGKQRSYGAGLTYALGPLTVGGSYYQSFRNRDPIGLDEKLQRFLVGARYALGPGVDLRGSAQYYDYKGALTPAAAAANNSSAWFFVFGTVLTF